MKCSRSRMTLSGWVVGSFGLLSLPRAADACSIDAPAGVIRGAPDEGQTDVPTDVIPIVDLDALRIFDVQALPDGLFTLHVLDGDDVPVTTQRVAAWSAEVRPAFALAPRTQYVLEAHVPTSPWGNGFELSLAFTTGSGPLRGVPAPVVASLQHWRFADDVALSSCDNEVEGTCLATSSEDLVETLMLTLDGREDSTPYLYRGPHTMDLTANNSGHPYRCVRLRRRALNGSFSEPTVSCGTDAPTVELHGDSSLLCGEQGIIHQGVLATPIASSADAGTTLAASPPGDASPIDNGVNAIPDSGCSLPGTSPGAGTSTTTVAALASIALFGRAARRSGRRDRRQA